MRPQCIPDGEIVARRRDRHQLMGEIPANHEHQLDSVPLGFPPSRDVRRFDDRFVERSVAV